MGKQHCLALKSVLKSGWEAVDLAAWGIVQALKGKRYSCTLPVADIDISGMMHASLEIKHLLFISICGQP